MAEEILVRKIEERTIRGLPCLIVRFRRDNSDVVDPSVDVVAILQRVGVTKRPKRWVVYEMDGVLYRRVNEDYVTGRKTRWFRNKRTRKSLLKTTSPYMLRKDGRVSGSVHLWSGGRPWGSLSKGKFCLTPCLTQSDLILG